jgi:hypothetical protein
LGILEVVLEAVLDTPDIPDILEGIRIIKVRCFKVGPPIEGPERST